jgi:hypothetical protein
LPTQAKEPGWFSRLEEEDMDLATARQKYRDATEQTIEEVFADDTLRGEFVILEPDADQAPFLQAGGEGDGPYTVEYKEAGKQYQCVRQLTKQEVKEAFLDYFRGGSVWRTRNEWKEMACPKGCLKQVAALLLLLSMIAWVLVP